MKILIVDDNAAIREIIRDILTGEGHNVRSASSVEEAVAKLADFSPDVLFLDSRVDGEDGLHILAQMDQSLTPDRLSVVLLKGAADMVPTDNPYIRASVDKPFTSKDIVGAIRDIQENNLEVREERESRRRFRMPRLRPLHVKHETIDAPTSSPDSHGVSFGSSYVVFEECPERIYAFIGLFDPSEYDVMVVTTGRAKAIKERFSYSNMEVLPLSGNGKAGSMGIQEIGTMMSRIRSFIDAHDRPVVAFDSFGDIMAADGINQSLLMLQQLMAGRSKMCTFAVSVDDSSLTDKDRNIFLHSMIEYRET